MAAAAPAGRFPCHNHFTQLSAKENKNAVTQFCGPGVARAGAPWQLQLWQVSVFCFPLQEIQECAAKPGAVRRRHRCPAGDFSSAHIVPKHVALASRLAAAHAVHRESVGGEAGLNFLRCPKCPCQRADTIYQCRIHQCRANPRLASLQHARWYHCSQPHSSDNSTMRRVASAARAVMVILTELDMAGI